MQDTPATETTVSYYQQRMDLLGVTPEINTIKLWQNGGVGKPDILVDFPVFKEVEAGIEILCYRLDRYKIVFAKENSRHRNKDYVVTRLEIPRTKKDGSQQKYDMPKGQPTVPFFPPPLVDMYDNGIKIPVLYMTEGYFKAFKAMMHGIPCIGLPSITCMKDRETNELYGDIKKLIEKCTPERIVWLTDGDCRDITGKDITDGIDLYKRPRNFFNTVATFSELLSKYDDIDKYFGHVNSENLEGNPKGLDDLLCAFPDSVDAIVKEFHKFDKISAGVNQGNYLVRIKISYGQVGKVFRYFHLQDVNDFYLYHAEKRPDLKGQEFVFAGTRYRYNDKDNKCDIVVPSAAGRYFRVGDGYYEHIDVPDKHGHLIRTFAGRQKTTITDDHGKKIIEHIPKYKAFCVVPDHVSYSSVIHNCFNMYHAFGHEPDEGECTTTLDFIKHIFGDAELTFTDSDGKERTVKRWELGLDYLTLLYKTPQQVLPILCLVSRERETGKTTFLNYLNKLFGENVAIVGNADLTNDFNAHWASKLIIGCDETKIDKHVTVEKVKSLSTASRISMNAKGRDQVNMEFFGKFVLLSNNEDNFIAIEEEEIRFWVIKVHSIKKKNQELLEDLYEEIPAFLHYLNTRQIVAPCRSRHWFENKLLHTEALENLKLNSKSGVEKNLRIAITELFEMTGDTEIYMPLRVIATELLKKPHDKDYIKKVLHQMGYLTQSVARKSYPRIIETNVDNEGLQLTHQYIKFFDRYYIFKREAFTDEPANDPKPQQLTVGFDDQAPAASVPFPDPTQTDLPF